MKNQPNDVLPLGRHATPPKPHRGWYSAKYLPHFDHPDIIQTLTFRLADSLPEQLLDRLERELTGAVDEDMKRRKQIEKWLDTGYGACYLKQHDVARTVEDAFLHFDGERYQLLEWVIMPNHTHVIFEPIRGHSLASILHSWRSYTAHEANRILGRTGRFWAKDYYDRYIRDRVHFQNAVSYCHENPVKAGLVSKPEEWPWGSARRRASSPDEEETGNL